MMMEINCIDSNIQLSKVKDEKQRSSNECHNLCCVKHLSIKQNELCKKPSSKFGTFKPKIDVLPNFTVYGPKSKRPRSACCKVKNTSPVHSKCGKTNVKAVPPVGSPVGLAFGTLNITDFLNKERLNCSLLQGYATCLMAFGEIYLTPEPEWNHHVLNGILQEGANHINNSLKEFSDEELAEVDVVSKCFTLRRNGMEVWVSEPVLVGMMECTSSRVYSFGVGIAMFMRKYQYCLLRVEDRFYLIWKKGSAYFLFDCYGRMVTCKTDFERGAVALICVGTLKKIDILLTYLGQVSPDSIFSLYELKMVRLMECCEQPFVCSGVCRKFNYNLISNDHAQLLSSYHIATDCFSENRYKQAIAMGLIAIIYSKIDAPCTWDTSIIDKILMMGNRCYEMWTGLNPEKCLNIHEIPRKVLVGQFNADIAIFPAAACGNWVNLPDYQVCEITRAIRNFFEELKFSNVLVQVDRKAYAIWRRDQFYYLFDPYPRELIHSTKSDGRKHATVHMFNSLKLLCCILTQDVIGISLPCKFSLSVVKILSLCKVNVQNLPEEPPWSCVDPRIKIDVEEALSLNESIYDIRCEEALACATDRYDIGYCDLDIPPLSETQNLPESEKAKAEDHPSSEEEELIEEEKETEEEEAEQEEQQSQESEVEKKKPSKAKAPKKPKAPKSPKPSKKGKGSDESSEEEGGKGKKPGKGKPAKETSKGKDKSKTKGKGKGKDGSGDESESSEEESSKAKKGKDKAAKGKDKEKAKREKEKKEKEKKEKEEKAKKEKEKKEKAKKEKGKGKGGLSEDSSEEENDAGKKGKKGKKEDKDKAKKDKKKEKEEKDKEKKEKAEREKKEKEEKKTKEKEKKEKGKDKKEKEKKDKDKKKEKGKGDETESASDEEGKKGKDKGKEKGKDKDKSKGDKGKGKEKDKKDSDKKAKGDGTSSEGSETSDEKSVSDKPSESSVSSEETMMAGKQQTESLEEFGKYGICPPAKEPKGGWPKGSGCLPNSYPGYTHIPRNLAVVGSETGTYQSLCQLLRSGLQVADRILTMTAWGNYVVFKNMASFLLYDGCTCNPCRFRNIDLSVGTAGLLCFDNMHDVIIEILKGKSRPASEQTRPLTVEEICNEYC